MGVCVCVWISVGPSERACVHGRACGWVRGAYEYSAKGPPADGRGPTCSILSLPAKASLFIPSGKLVLNPGCTEEPLGSFDAAPRPRPHPGDSRAIGSLQRSPWRLPALTWLPESPWFREGPQGGAAGRGRRSLGLGSRSFSACTSECTALRP